jgi:hypothetical protein
MATFRAINTVAEALAALLRSSYRPAEFNGHELEFRVYLAHDFAKPMTAGISVFLYRVLSNGSLRTPPGRLANGSARMKSQLPLDLHFLMTIWGRDASLQHRACGWMMRTLEDTPVLPGGLLDAVAPGVFRGDETVEVVLAELRTEDLMHLWEHLATTTYQLSIPYVARNVRIESTEQLPPPVPVYERTFDYAVPRS